MAPGLSTAGTGDGATSDFIVTLELMYQHAGQGTTGTRGHVLQLLRFETTKELKKLRRPVLLDMLVHTFYEFEASVVCKVSSRSVKG